MISLTTLIIAGVLLAAAVLAAVFVPHPITWLMALALGGLFFFVLLSKHQGQRQAVRQGVEIQAQVQKVRHWSHKAGSGNYIDQYEIIAAAPNPHNGSVQQFVSPPLGQNPEPYLDGSVKVKVDWSNPKAYVMDLSFLPFAVH